MTIYLHDIPFEQAISVFHGRISKSGWGEKTGAETIPVDENAVGRILAESAFALISSPHYHSTAMDGFAVKSDSTVGAAPSKPIELPAPGESIYLDTGDPIPDWANAVIPIEEVEPLEIDGSTAKDPRKPGQIRIRAAVPPWAHIRPMGEDMVATQLVLAKGQALTPYDLGALAASGNHSLKVVRRPRVGILPTGSELVETGKPAARGEIIEFNSIVLAAQVNQWGGQARRYPITRDDLNLIRDSVQRAADENDLILLNAGSSAGAEDYSSQVIGELGTLLVHGIAIRPGHPVILGMVRRSRGAENGGEKEIPVIGVPGYPVSAALTGELIVEPLISHWLGKSSLQRETITATLTRKITSPAGDDDYIRVVAGRVGSRMLANPLPRGAGVISSLSKADGLIKVPAGSQGVEAGEEVNVLLYRQRSELEKTIVAIGSHDMTLDLLAQALLRFQRRLVSANVGSQGGLVALRRGDAHLAGSHLLDPETGDYNIRSIREYLGGIKVKLFIWAGRSQGLILQKGNPKSILRLQDLAREDVSFINRQRGSGTRVLLDYHLSRSEINAGAIRGYPDEEFTHLGVAAAVQSGRADCGLGVAAAAVALGLDFVPLFDERYDLVIPAVFAESELMTPIFSLMADPDFRVTISNMPGYDVSRMGELVAEL